MSLVNGHGKKMYLPRVGPNPFWVRIREQLGDDHRAWRRFMMLAMREGLEWPIAWIAEAFDLHQGTVSRNLSRAKAELREMLDETGRG